MKLQPHKPLIRDGERNKGYAIRIGQKVPKNSANLAYVQSKPVSPEENILLEDVSSLINENGLANFIEKEYIVYPSKEYLLETENGQSIFPTDSISITDEFTIRKNRQDTPKPVFYKMELSGRFDARSASVLPYQGGYSTETKQEAVMLESIDPSKRKELLFVGDSIRLEADGGQLKDDEVYKVQLVREENFLYRIIVYTNFRNSKKATYKVVYPQYIEELGKSVLKEEVLNAYPFFEQVTNAQFKEIIKQMESNPNTFSHSKVYTVVENGDEFSFYATSDMLVANYDTRQPQVFQHRMEAKLKTKLSETNPGQINVGFYFAQTAVGVENLLSVGKLLNEHTLLPSYLEIVNPHPTELDLVKRDIRYWTVDLDMPEHHYEDYDLIIIAGYGSVSLSMFHDKFDYYLKNGGTIWIDNNGSGANVLNMQGFISDIQFSKSSNEYGVKQLVSGEPYFSRLYPITNNQALGYSGVSPAIVFGIDEEKDQWTTIANHLNGGPSIIKKNYEERGTIIVSNCGILRGFYHNQSMNNYFVLNTILHHAEEQWVLTPWRHDFVYHRENLFSQEYKVNNADVYINDRNDYNSNEIVAKKILHNSSKDYVKTFCKEWFYNASGTYHHSIKGDIEVAVNNSEFESGNVDSNGDPITQWTASTSSAIPGWNTKILAGKEVVFSHDSTDSLFGVRHISINSSNGSTGAQAYWESEDIYLAADSYKIESWIRTNQVRGVTTDGIKIGIYNLSGEKIASSSALTGNRSTKKIALSFEVDKPQVMKIRLGFVDGNGFGKANFDNIALCTAGSVRGVSSNKGEKPVYAFSVKPNASTIDIEAEGFGNANITRATPEVPFTYTIKPFIYQWITYGNDPTTGEEYGRYERMYGTEVSFEHSVRKSDGLISLGYLHALLPAVPSGKEWYDQNKIYYKISLGARSDIRNNLVNLKLLDRKTGKEWYYSDELVIGYKDIFWATDKPSFVLHAETDYETVRATKRNFGLQLIDDRRIYVELPQTKDAKENWYLRIHNGQFIKSSLGYKEWSELHQTQNSDVMTKYQERVMRKEKYQIKEYDAQIFHPSIGIMRVENEMEYLTPRTVKVPHDNLHIKKGSVEMEQLTPYGIVGSYNLMPFRYDSFEGLENEQAARVATSNTVAQVQEEKAMDGAKSLKISGTATEKEVYLDRAQGASENEPILVSSGQNYIFSFYILSGGAGQVTAIARFKNGATIQSSAIAISKVNEWQRIELPFEAPVGSDSVSLGFKFKGTEAYIDCTQFEIAE